MDTADKHIVAIDLGSSKIALTVAKVNGADIQIIYYKETPSHGIKYSSVVNVKNVTDSLSMAIREAEEQLGYLSLISGNHDTWRIANYLNDDQLRIFYMMLFTLPGIPFVLYGDEIGMKTVHIPSKDGGYQRTGSRLPMIWNDEEPNHGFTETAEPYLPFCKENDTSVEKAMKDHDSLYSYICHLIMLRSSFPDLVDSHVGISEKNRVLTFTRGKYLVIVNLSDKEYEFSGTVIIRSREFTGKLPPQTAVLVRE